MEQTNSSTQVQKQEFSTPKLTPNEVQVSTPATSPRKNVVPSTPPPPTSDATGVFNSPDAYTHTHTILPPVTPSSHLHSNNKVKLGNVPQTPHSSQSTPFGDESPLKSPSQARDDDGEKPPIRHLTSKLRTRLNYAFVKYSNGWANQNLDEVEKIVVEKEREDIDGKFGTLSPQRTKQNGTLVASPFGKPSLSPSRITKPAQRASPFRTHRRSMEPLDAGGSAHTAFLNALAKSKSPRRTLPVNRPPPLQLHTPGDISPAATHTARSPEAEAIETLMSLSSPQAFKPKHELPRHTLPKKLLNFGENLVPNETAVETESDTEYEATDDESEPKKRTVTGNSNTDDDVKMASTQPIQPRPVDDDPETASEHED